MSSHSFTVRDRFRRTQEQEKMLKSFALLFLIAAVRDVAAQSSVCGPHPPMENKCQRKKCIPRVSGTEISWDEVTPKSFVARWKPVSSAKCYYIELLSAYTINVLKTISCFKGSIYEFAQLRPNWIYGVRVSVVNSDCKRGRPGVPARTRTLWAPTTAPTTRPFITPTPEPGKCGKNFFTCHSNQSECVRVKGWCNRRLDCVDGTDERGCPGGCEEIDVDFKNGNYSCTRWGSPGSVCLFDCKEPYVRDGYRLTVCRRREKKWSRRIPTCRLNSTSTVNVIREESTETSVTLQWGKVEGAARYTFLAIEVTRPGETEAALMRTKSVDASECCKVQITDLKPDTEFQVIVRAVDGEDVDGLKSNPVFARTIKAAPKEAEESVEKKGIDGEGEKDAK